MYKQKMSRNIEIIGEKVALKLGLIYGFGFLFLLTLFGILASDGLFGLIGIGVILSSNYLFVSLVLLYSAFPLALSFFGKYNSRNLMKGKSVMRTSAEFSFGVNFVIWQVFLLSQLILNQFENFIQLNLTVLVLILILGTLTSSTLGVLIVKSTEEKINAST